MRWQGGRRGRETELAEYKSRVSSGVLDHAWRFRLPDSSEGEKTKAVKSAVDHFLALDYGYLVFSMSTSLWDRNTFSKRSKMDCKECRDVLDLYPLFSLSRLRRDGCPSALSLSLRKLGRLKL